MSSTIVETNSEQEAEQLADLLEERTGMNALPVSTSSPEGTVHGVAVAAENGEVAEWALLHLRSNQ